MLFFVRKPRPRAVGAILAGAAAALVCVIALIALWPPARGLVVFAKGQAGTCSAVESMRARHDTLAQMAFNDQIRAGTRVLRQDGQFKLCQTPRGQFWIPGDSEEAMEFDLAEQVRGIYGKDARAVKSGDVVLDCGANVGVFTREALNRGAKLVVSIEPGPENVECLRRTFTHEIAAGRVIVYPKGVWDHDDVLTLSVDPKNSARDSFLKLEPGTFTVPVPLTTIDKLVPELQLPRVDFIKMDIEGAEQKAIAGARATISKYKPRMALCIYHLPADPVMVPLLVKQMNPGYSSGCGCMMYNQDKIQPQVAFFY